MFLFKNKE